MLIVCISDRYKFYIAFNYDGQRVAIKLGTKIEVIYNFGLNQKLERYELYFNSLKIQKNKNIQFIWLNKNIIVIFSLQ